MVNTPKSNNTHPVTPLRRLRLLNAPTFDPKKPAPSRAGKGSQTEAEHHRRALKRAALQSGEDQHRIYEAAGKPTPKHSQHQGSEFGLRRDMGAQRR
jgi:hypothetical protein